MDYEDSNYKNDIKVKGSALMNESDWKMLALSLIVGKNVLITIPHNFGVFERTVDEVDVAANVIKLRHIDSKYYTWYKLSDIQIVKVL